MKFDFAWDVGSSVTYDECEKLAELAKGKRVLEIGSWLGRSAIALGSTAKMVLTVDWHQGDFYAGNIPTLEGLEANLAAHGATNVEVIIGLIEDVWSNLKPGFGMIFIDADHEAEAVRRHWEIALKLIKPKGTIVFHDYGRFGVTEVVDSLDLEFEVLESLAIIHV